MRDSWKEVSTATPLVVRDASWFSMGVLGSCGGMIIWTDDFIVKKERQATRGNYKKSVREI